MFIAVLVGYPLEALQIRMIKPLGRAFGEISNNLKPYRCASYVVDAEVFNVVANFTLRDNKGASIFTFKQFTACFRRFSATHNDVLGFASVCLAAQLRVISLIVNRTEAAQILGMGDGLNPVGCFGISEELVSIQEAADIRGVSPQSIENLMKRGKLKTVAISTHKFLFRDEVQNFKPSKGGRPRTRPDKKSTKRRSRKSK